jgi:PhnB protein
MAKQTPYIFSEDAQAQAQFYTQALGGEILSSMTYGQQNPNAGEDVKDKVLHLSLMAAGVSILMSDAVFMPLQRGNAINLVLEFDAESEAYAAFDKLAQGGKVNDPLKPAFWGALFGQLEDKYGINWMITTTAPASQG